MTLKIPSRRSTARIKEKGSEFIGFVYPVSSSGEAELELEKLRKEYYNATHCCYAYTLAEGTARYSDDGEPAGTAGKRIMGAVTAAEVTDVLVAVIRYYGGVNLGTGLLGKSYQVAAASALEVCEYTFVTQYSVVEIIFPYDYSGKVFSLAGRAAYKLENFLSNEMPAIRICILPELLNALTKELTDVCRGNITITVKDSVFLP